MTHFTTVYQQIAAHGDRTPDAIAILAPGQTPLTYAKLQAQIQTTSATLGELGIDHSDRVALVLPSGPELAVAILAVSCCAVAMPLNPAHPEQEFERLLRVLQARIVIVQAAIDSPVRAITQRLGISLVELVPESHGAGCFSLNGTPWATGRCSLPVQPDDLALILHTSGTTAKPKIVPLTHRNICTSASNVQKALQIESSDRGLNIVPMYHCQGIIAMLLSSISAGASLICAPQFEAVKFFEWMAELKPTWYGAVPTIHAAIAKIAEDYSDIIQQNPLRLIRTASIPLQPRLHNDLERIFNAPVINAYGMTEAYQVACNPLPPAKRKLGSVGIATNTEIAIMDATGKLLQPYELGEVAVRGANVMAGYENDPETNLRQFVDGWFRTGDQGYLDEEGYLFLTGRLKEMINRGGEKVSPWEVDQALLAHPKVEQAVAFAIPHLRLGEDIAAAVILQPNEVAIEAEIRTFVAERLASFKVPSQIIFVDTIPKNATGKIQRIGLAEKLKAALQEDYVAPKTTVEKKLALLWQDILGVEQVGMRDNFFALGGDSLQALQLLTQIQQVFGRTLPPDTIFRTLTIEHLITVLHQNLPRSRSPLVPIQPHGGKPPLFAVHDVSGQVACYRHLVQYLDPDQPFYGLQAEAVDPDGSLFCQIESIASHYLKAIAEIQPQGPYFLAGYSFGGLIAFEMAQQLQQQGQQVAFLGLLDTFAQGDRRPFTLSQKLRRHLRYLTQEGIDYISKRIVKYSQSVREGRSLKSMFAETEAVLPASPLLATAFTQARETYNPQIYPGKITFFCPVEREIYQEWCIFDPVACWSPRTTQPLNLQPVPGSHPLMLQEPHVSTLAQMLTACLHQAQQTNQNWDAQPTIRNRVAETKILN